MCLNRGFGYWKARNLTTAAKHDVSLLFSLINVEIPDGYQELDEFLRLRNSIAHRRNLPADNEIRQESEKKGYREQWLKGPYPQYEQPLPKLDEALFIKFVKIKLSLAEDLLKKCGEVISNFKKVNLKLKFHDLSYD